VERARGDEEKHPFALEDYVDLDGSEAEIDKASAGSIQSTHSAEGATTAAKKVGKGTIVHPKLFIKANEAKAKAKAEVVVKPGDVESDSDSIAKDVVDAKAGKRKRKRRSGAKQAAGEKSSVPKEAKGFKPIVSKANRKAVAAIKCDEATKLKIQKLIAASKGPKPKTSSAARKPTVGAKPVANTRVVKPEAPNKVEKPKRPVKEMKSVKIVKSESSSSEDEAPVPKKDKPARKGRGKSKPVVKGREDRKGKKKGKAIKPTHNGKEIDDDDLDVKPEKEVAKAWKYVDYKSAFKTQTFDRKKTPAYTEVGHILRDLYGRDLFPTGKAMPDGAWEPALVSHTHPVLRAVSSIGVDMVTDAVATLIEKFNADRPFRIHVVGDMKYLQPAQLATFKQKGTFADVAIEVHRSYFWTDSKSITRPGESDCRHSLEEIAGGSCLTDRVACGCCAGFDVTVFLDVPIETPGVVARCLSNSARLGVPRPVALFSMNYYGGQPGSVNTLCGEQTYEIDSDREFVKVGRVPGESPPYHRHSRCTWLFREGWESSDGLVILMVRKPVGAFQHINLPTGRHFIQVTLGVKPNHDLNMDPIMPCTTMTFDIKLDAVVQNELWATGLVGGVSLSGGLVTRPSRLKVILPKVLVDACFVHNVHDYKTGSPAATGFGSIRNNVVKNALAFEASSYLMRRPLSASTPIVDLALGVVDATHMCPYANFQSYGAAVCYITRLPDAAITTSVANRTHASVVSYTEPYYQFGLLSMLAVVLSWVGFALSASLYEEKSYVKLAGVAFLTAALMTMVVAGFVRYVRNRTVVPTGSTHISYN
jgi:hypothetical protein